MLILLKIIPNLAIAAFFTVGYMTNFDPNKMRPATALMILVLLPTLIYLGRRNEASPIDYTMSGYVLLGAMGFWFSPQGLGKLLADYSAVGLYAAFLLMSVIPLLTGQPTFTEYFARKRTPEAARQTIIYKNINRNMTWIWTIIYALCGLLALAPKFFPVLNTGFINAIFQFILPLAILLGVGLPFTKRYPDYYQRKLGLSPVTVKQTSFNPLEETMSDSDQQKPAGPQAAANCRELLQMMPLGFNPESAQELKAVIQFEVSEEQDFSAYLSIADGACTYHEGTAPNPDLTITTPGRVWLAIAQGELDGQAAFMGGQYKVNGDLSLLLRFKQLFS